MFTNRLSVYKLLPMTHLLDRQTVELPQGRIAYADQGSGPAALFVHGVFLNADLWRNVIPGVSDLRRCIAVDLPAHGATAAGPHTDVSLDGLATVLGDLCDALDLEQVDLVANDTGGAVAQVFAASHPDRLRSLTLTNCDVHDNFPPARFKPIVDLAVQGQLAPLVVAMAGDKALARSEQGLGSGYEQPDLLPDEVIDSYLGPFVADGAKAIERFVASVDAKELMAVEPQLRQLKVPTLVAWGTDDSFFELSWAERLREMIPGVQKVVEIAGAKLFYPDERAADLIPHLRSHFSDNT
jgi:pimeloyl-ACP methyl ester carboxylesterase